MKKSISLLVYVLALTLVMYNCKKKEEPFPLEPDTKLMKELDGIKMELVTLTPPAPVTTTPATLTVSAQMQTTATDISKLKDGTVPAAVQTTANEVKAAISTSEINTLASVNASTIAAVAAGGAVPANLKAILDKAAANPAIQAYLPRFTMPTINGKAVSGRTGVTEAVEGIESLEGIEVEDACVKAADQAFTARKVGLDSDKVSETAKVTTAYNAAIAPLASAEAACKAGIPARYATFRTAGQAQVTQILNDLEAAKNNIPADLYNALKGFSNLTLLSFLETVNRVENADLNSCTALTTAKTDAAKVARDADLKKVNDSYNNAMSIAAAKRSELIKSCHNQGGGK